MSTNIQPFTLYSVNLPTNEMSEQKRRSTDLNYHINSVTTWRFETILKRRLIATFYFLHYGSVAKVRS